jgi:hypothetical protein
MNPYAEEGAVSQPPARLLSVRSAVVLVLALVVAATVGLLSYLSTHDLPAAILAAGSATTGALSMFRTLLAR